MRACYDCQYNFSTCVTEILMDPNKLVRYMISRKWLLTLRSYWLALAYWGFRYTGRV